MWTDQQIAAFEQDVDAMRELAQKAWDEGWWGAWLFVASTLAGWRLRLWLVKRSRQAS